MFQPSGVNRVGKPLTRPFSAKKWVTVHTTERQLVRVSHVVVRATLMSTLTPVHRSPRFSRNKKALLWVAGAEALRRPGLLCFPGRRKASAPATRLRISPHPVAAGSGV